MKPSSYQVIGFEVIAVDRLKPHPSARMPIDEEDQRAMSASILDRGVIVPLLVTESGDGYLVVDGCNRLQFAQSSGITEVPCVLIETENVRSVVMECLATGRKRSTGQRVMAFLELHKREVLRVAEIVGTGQFQRLKGRHGASRESPQIPKGFEDFTVERIAERLGVSRADVGMGIELLQATEGASEADAPKFEDVRNKLLAGAMPIRRWRPAMAGKWAPQRGKADVDYGMVLLRGLDHIKTAISHWKKIDPMWRGRAEKIWHEQIAPNLPEQLR